MTIILKVTEKDTSQCIKRETGQTIGFTPKMTGWISWCQCYRYKKKQVNLASNFFLFYSALTKKETQSASANMQEDCWYIYLNTVQTKVISL